MSIPNTQPIAPTMDLAHIGRLPAVIMAICLTPMVHGATFAVATPNDASPVFGGTFGTRFQVGSSPLLVSSLGGYDIHGSGPISVGIWDAGGQIVASTLVTFTGSQGYVFASLVTPVQLVAGLEYVVALQSGDVFALGSDSNDFFAVDSFGAGVQALADVEYIGVSGPPAGLAGDFEYPAGRFASANFQYAVVPELESQVGAVAAVLAGLGLARQIPGWSRGRGRGRKWSARTGRSAG